MSSACITTRRRGRSCCAWMRNRACRPWTWSQPVLPMMPGMPERRSCDYARHGVTSLFAAFNIADGTVISELHRQHRAVEFKKFLVAIDKAVPGELDVHLVCDNLATHKTPAIRDWLARHPRFHVHFTPTGSSWINQVERWFGFLTDQMIRRGVHKSVQALEKDVRAWIQTWNENPRPFMWTKTAEEILDSLAKYIARISGAGHSSRQVPCCGGHRRPDHPEMDLPAPDGPAAGQRRDRRAHRPARRREPRLGMPEDPGRTAQARSPGERVHDPPGSQNSADPAGAEAALQTGPAIWARLRLMGGRIIEPMQESRS